LITKLDVRADVADQDDKSKRNGHRAPETPLPAPPTPAQRLAAARALQPPSSSPCRDCWTRGQRAAILAMEAGEDPGAVRPGVRDQHDLRAFNAGRDAVAECSR
jgi:hypothetical protein